MDVFLIEKIKTGKAGKTGCNIRTNFRENSLLQKILRGPACSSGKLLAVFFAGMRGEIAPGGKNLQKLKLKSKIFLFFYSLIYKFAPETDLLLTIGLILIVLAIQNK